MIEIIPNWHPVLVHFTVALLFLSAVLYVLAHLPWAASLRAEWLIVAQWMLWLGAGFALATAATGWLAYNSVDHDDVSHLVMTTHRNWALATVAVFVALAVWTAWRRIARHRQTGPLINAVFYLLLMTGTFLLSTTAWYGAELVFRHGLGVKSLPNTPKTSAPTPAAPPGQRPAAKPPVHDHSTHTH